MNTGTNSARFLGAMACLLPLLGLTRTGASQADLVTVNLRAVITASSQFKDGEISERESATVSYSETTVRRLIPVNSSSLDVREVSHSGLVEASGQGRMVWGQGLPVSEWTFAYRQPEHSLIRLALKPDRQQGSVGLEDFLAYKSLNLKCEGGDPEQWRPKAEATGLLDQAWSGFCQAKSTNPPSLALPFRLDAGTGSITHAFEVQSQYGTGKLTLNCSIKLAAEQPRPQARLQARPQVAPSVVRGEPLVLDGSRSSGDIQSYQWTFFPAPNCSGLTPPRSQAHKEGDVARVILLDSMKVKLTVSDGRSSDSRTVDVTVIPRQNFRTTVQHHEETQVGSWEDAPVPATSNLSQATFKNDCKSDPNQALEHITHPNLDKGKAEDYATVTSLEDPGGPFDGYAYFQDWKLKIQRKTMINKWLLPAAPPVVAGMPNWYNQNGSSTAMYFLRRADRAARSQTERIREFLANQSDDASPERWAEKAYASDSSLLSQKLLSRLVECEARLRPILRAKVNIDAPTVQIWDPDSGSWKKVQVYF